MKCSPKLTHEQKSLYKPARGFEPRIFSLQVRCVTTAPYGPTIFIAVNMH